MPVYQKLGIDFTRCYPGTLNVSIAPKTFRMLASEPTLRGVKWIEEHRPEDFFLSQCRIKFRDHIYGGWVYYPDPRTKQKHFFPPSSMEIVAEHISGIQYGDEVMLEINPKEISIEPESAL